jgi:alpha-beta hydrolase superfamily lysophospholipase
MDPFLISHSDLQVQAYRWLPAGKPVAIIQIAHGMQEYALRYEHFAEWMNAKGIAVYTNDHIGHGLSAKSEAELGHFPRKDDWQRQVDLLHQLTLKIKAMSPGLPVFILGHSMGSVLVQTYMIRYGKEVDGYVLSGVIQQPLLMANIGILLVRLLSMIFGPEDRSKLIVSLGYGSYYKKFKPYRTKCDWLSRDDRIVDEYLASPLCGKRLTNMFYYNFFHGFKFIARRKNLAQIPSGKPVLIISGQDDPAGFSGKAPKKIQQLLTKYAGANVDLKLYPGGRHEILNEINREEVYCDVLGWIRNISLRA